MHATKDPLQEDVDYLSRMELGRVTQISSETAGRLRAAGLIEDTYDLLNSFRITELPDTFVKVSHQGRLFMVDVRSGLDERYTVPSG